MNIVNRLWTRISKDGVSKTIYYCSYVLIDVMRNFIYELVMDLRYSGRMLYGNQKTPYSHLGAHDIYHTEYAVMPLIFKYVKITPSDILVDVGCGKGRVINYWLSKGHRNKIIGLELDPSVAAQTAKQLRKWTNVTIVPGDAVHNLPQEGTIFYFFNPFSELKVKQFQKRMLELFHNKPVTIIYYRPKSLYVFKNDNWHIKVINFERQDGIRSWGRLNKYYELAIITRDTNQSYDKKQTYIPITRKPKPYR